MASFDWQPTEEEAALYRRVIGELDAKRAAEREAGPGDNEYTRAAAKFEAKRAAEREANERAGSDVVVLKTQGRNSRPKDRRSVTDSHASWWCRAA